MVDAVESTQHVAHSVYVGKAGFELFGLPAKE